MEKFGDRLRKLRNNKNLLQEDLANIMNISKSSIGMYERNEREPSFELITKLSNYFNVSTDYLLLGKETSTPLEKNLFFFDTTGLTAEELEDIKKHIEFIKFKAGQERGKVE